jgi:hypothetical protein
LSDAQVDDDPVVHRCAPTAQPQVDPEHESPASQVVSQHGSPYPPQATHWSVAEQTVVDEHCAAPAQHGCPALPQGSHESFAPHTKPSAQAEPAQHI